MSAFKTDGDFTTAEAIAAPMFSSPLDGVATEYVFTQPFMQLRANFTATAIGTAHPTLTGWYLAKEGDRKPIGQGLIEWVRTYVKKPAQWVTYEQVSYQFPGFYGATGTAYLEGREPFVEAITAKVEHDFYLILASGGDYTSPDSIPINARTSYYWSGDASNLSNYLADSPPFTNATVPSRTTYIGWRTGATFAITIEDSQLEPWILPVYVRRTRKIRAK